MPQTLNFFPTQIKFERACDFFFLIVAFVLFRVCGLSSENAINR